MFYKNCNENFKYFNMYIYILYISERNVKPECVLCMCCNNDKKKKQKTEMLFEEFSNSFNN